MVEYGISHGCCFRKIGRFDDELGLLSHYAALSLCIRDGSKGFNFQDGRNTIIVLVS